MSNNIGVDKLCAIATQQMTAGHGRITQAINDFSFMVFDAADIVPKDQENYAKVLRINAISKLKNLEVLLRHEITRLEEQVKSGVDRKAGMSDKEQEEYYESARKFAAHRGGRS